MAPSRDAASRWAAWLPEALTGPRSSAPVPSAATATTSAPQRTSRDRRRRRCSHTTYHTAADTASTARHSPPRTRAQRRAEG